MQYYVQDWFGLLRNAGGTASFPLIVSGLGLMLFGWRMWRVCVMLGFGLIGAGVGWALAESVNMQGTYAAIGAGVLGVTSYWARMYAIVALGGLIGGAVVMAFLSQAGLYGMPLWALSGAGFAGCVALALLNRQHVVILVTATMGAALVVSGVVTLLASSKPLYGTLRQMVDGSAMVLPFILLVPTVMSCFYQVAEVKRLQVEL